MRAALWLALEFFGDNTAASAFEHAMTQLTPLGGVRVTIDHAPLAGAAALQTSQVEVRKITLHQVHMARQAVRP